MYYRHTNIIIHNFADEQACMQSAGLAAKRRRSRAQSWSCTSSRTRPTSQESISLDRFMEILNNSEGQYLYTY